MQVYHLLTSGLLSLNLLSVRGLTILFHHLLFVWNCILYIPPQQQGNIIVIPKLEQLCNLFLKILRCLYYILGFMKTFCFLVVFLKTLFTCVSNNTSAFVFDEWTNVQQHFVTFFGWLSGKCQQRQIGNCAAKDSSLVLMTNFGKNGERPHSSRYRFVCSFSSSSRVHARTHTVSRAVALHYRVDWGGNDSCGRQGVLHLLDTFPGLQLSSSALCDNKLYNSAIFDADCSRHAWGRFTTFPLMIEHMDVPQR